MSIIWRVCSRRQHKKEYVISLNTTRTLLMHQARNKQEQYHSITFLNADQMYNSQ